MQEIRHNSTRRSITSRGKKIKSRKKERYEVSSGGIVYKKTRRGIYFAMIKDSYGHWAFPKGHVRRTETNEQAARREIKEEVGLSDLKMIVPLGKIEIKFKDQFVFKGFLIKKTIHYFLFETHEKSTIHIPKIDLEQKGEKIQGLRWVSLREVRRRSTYRDMQPVLEKAIKRLQKDN